MMYTYRKGITTGRAMTFLWNDLNGTAIDFTGGYTFAAYITDSTTPATLAGTKTTGITASTPTDVANYNLLIDWAPSDFTALTGDRTYNVTLVATPSGGDPFAFPGPAQFRLEAAPA